MFKVFSFCTLFLISSLVYGQSDEFPASDELTDEFDISEPAFEINSSQGELGNEAPSTEPDLIDEMTAEAPNLKSEGTEAANKNSSNEESKTTELTSDPMDSQNEDNTVLVREKTYPQLENQNLATDSVELRSSRSIFLPYKKRQSKWGFNISLGAEMMSFPNLVSQYDTNTFQDLFGSEPVPMTGIELGPKYNANYGSFAFLLGYGSLNTASSRIGSKSELGITRYSATLLYYVDTIWSEPYFVPYVGGGVWQAEYTEKSESEPDNDIRYTTDIGYHWRIGALFGLDWIEPKTALEGRRSIGLQATFINIYATSSYMSESDPDPDLENEMDFGASLVLEF